MSYDENDAAYDRFIDELHKDFREQALDDAELYDKIVDDSRHRVCARSTYRNPSSPNLRKAR